MTANSTFGLHGINCRNSFFVSLIIVFLFSSLFIGMFAGCVEGQNTVRVGTEAELNAAINNAENGVPLVIALDKNIALTNTLFISINKDIMLKSNSNTTSNA